MQTEIAEILNNMREENQRNIENFEKVLSGINTKLEAMEEDNEAVELVRFYIAELKKAMEDRFSASMIKYDAFEASFDGIISAQSELAKTSELKDLFGVFSAHNEAFMAEISSQKNLLDILDEKLSQIDEKSVGKDELSSMVQDVSLDLTVLGENVRKTFSQLEDEIKALDVSENLATINQTVDELRGLIASAPDYSGEFENLENKFENLVTEADFADFRENLGDFIQKIVDNSSALNSEMSFNAERILDAVNSIDYSELKGGLSLLQGCLDELKQVSYQASFDKINEILANIQDNIQNLPASVSADVQENYGAVKAGLDEFATNLQTIKEDLVSVVIEQKFNPDEILEALGRVNQDLSAFSSDIKENDDNNYNALKDYIEEVSSNVNSLMDSASVLKTDTVINREKLYELTECLNKFEPVDYSYDLQQISSKLDDLTGENVSISSDIQEKFENIKELVESLDNSDAVRLQFESFERAFSQILTTEDFSHFKGEFAEFIQKIVDNSNVLYENSNSLKSQLNERAQEVQAKLADLLVNVQYLKDVSSQNSYEFLDNVKQCVNDAVEKLNSNSEINFGDLKGSFENIMSEIAEIKDDFAQKNDTNVFNISSGFDNIKVSLENIVSALHSMGATNESLSAVDEKINRLNDVISALSSDLLLKQDEIVSHVNDLNEQRYVQIKSVSENVESLRGCIDAGVEALKNYLSELEVSSNNMKNASDEKVTQKLLDLESSLVQSAGEYEQKMELLQTKITEFAHIVENSNSDTEGKIASSLDEIASIKDELVSLSDVLKSSKISADEKSSETISLIDAGVENIIFSINNLNGSLVNDIDASVKENFSVIDEKFDKFASLITDLKDQHSLNNFDLVQDIENKVSALKDELSLVNADVAQAVQCEDIARAVDELKADINSLNGLDFESVLADLKEQLETSFMNFTVDVHSDFISNSENVSRLEQAFKDVYDKFSAIEDCVNDKIQNNIEQLQIAVENGIRDIKLNFEGRLEEQLGELKDYFDVALNNVNSEKSFNELKDDIFETSTKLHQVQDEIKLTVNELNSKLDIMVSDASAEEMKVQIDELLENKEKVVQLLSALQAKVDIMALDDSLRDEISLVEQKISDMLSALNAKVDSIALNDGTLELSDRVDEIFETEQKVSDMLSALNAKIDSIALNDGTLELSDRVDEISETEQKVSDMLSALHAKVDTIVEGNSDFDILEEIDGIKDIIFEQRKFFEVSSDEKASAIDKYLRDVLLKLDNVDMERNAEDIKEAILSALVSLFDQISFVEETEEIKDFVEEKTDEINQNLIEVQNQLKQLTNPGDDFDYKYSLQDVETDIAKLRLAISNMSGNDFSEVTDEIKKIVDAVEGLENSLTQEQIVDLKSDIEKLNEDIVSISSRTNKLLLTSDESYKALNEGLNNFSNVIYKLEDRINYLDNTEISERIERKIDSIHSLAVEADNANKVSRQVMMYLGEWIDAAGENISVITEKTAEIDNIKESIQQLKEAVPEKSDILNAIEKKFEQQEERLDRLEMKLEKVLSTLEEKDDMVLNRKVDNIENLLSGLGKNIEKLASYVDEE